MKNNFKIATKTLLIVLLFQVFSGCLVLPGKLIPVVNVLPDKSMYKNKPKVFIDVNFHTYLKGLHSAPVENITAKDIFITVVKKVTENSNAFQSYTLDKFESSGMDYTLQIDMQNYGNNTGAIFAGLVSGLTLMTIPVAVKDNYRLNAKLLNAEGNEIKTYVYDDYVKTWIHLFLFPFVGSLKKVPKNVMENMLQNLYNDLLKDQNLEYSKTIFFQSKVLG